MEAWKWRVLPDHLFGGCIRLLQSEKPAKPKSDEPSKSLRTAGLQVSEYAPNAVKKAVIGVGHGDKKQIHMMVKVLMPKAVFDTDDAADALAIAICHAHHRQSAIGRLRLAEQAEAATP